VASGVAEGGTASMGWGGGGGGVGPFPWGQCRPLAAIAGAYMVAVSCGFFAAAVLDA
jgi:hypothetical protein